MSMSEPKIVSLTERKGDGIRKPFVPLTGNPENHDYADWYRCLRDSGAPVDFRLHPPEEH
jgi:hypothetical protein